MKNAESITLGISVQITQSPKRFRLLRVPKDAPPLPIDAPSAIDLLFAAASVALKDINAPLPSDTDLLLASGEFEDDNPSAPRPAPIARQREDLLFEAAAMVLKPRKLRKFYNPSPPAEAMRFVELLTGSRDAIIRARLVHDRRQGQPREIAGTLTDIQSRLAEANGQGYGVFMQVNEACFDLDEEAFSNRDDIVGIRAVFVDGDGIKQPEDFDLPPSIVCERDGRWHAYWFTDETVTLAHFGPAQKALARKFGTDPRIFDLPRIMRMPGYDHCKNGTAPGYKLRVVAGARRYGIAELRNFLGALTPEPVKPRSQVDGVALDSPDRIASAIHYLKGEVAAGRVAIEGQHGDDRSIVVASELGDRGVSKEAAIHLFAEHFNPHCVPPWDDGGRQKVENAYYSRQNPLGCKSTPQAAFADVMKHVTPETVTPAKLPLISLASALKMERKPVEWTTQNLILTGHPNLLIGPGGLGKSTLANGLAVSVAHGAEFYGIPCAKQDVLYISTEDNRDRITDRMEAFAKQNELPADADNLMVIGLDSLDGFDPQLCVIDDDGETHLLPFYDLVRDALLRLNNPFLILDGGTDFFTFKDGVLTVNAYAKRVLLRLCRETGATILQLMHPSRHGTDTGENYGGAVAWNTAFRNRLSLMTEGSGVAGKSDTDAYKARILKVEKSNYAPSGEVLKLRFNPIGNTFINWTASSQREKDDTIKKAVLTEVLDLLGKGIQVRKAYNGNGHGPNEISAALREKGIPSTKQAVVAALSSLERDRKLRYQSAVGKTPATYIVVVEDEAVNDDTAVSASDASHDRAKAVKEILSGLLPDQTLTQHVLATNMADKLCPDVSAEEHDKRVRSYEAFLNDGAKPNRPEYKLIGAYVREASRSGHHRLWGLPRD